MEIFKKGIYKRPFYELRDGEIFESDGECYLKINHIDGNKAISLTDYTIQTFCEEGIIIPLEARLLVGYIECRETDKWDWLTEEAER